MDLFEANTSNASKILKESWSQFSIPQKIQIALVEKNGYKHHFTGECKPGSLKQKF